MTSPDKIESLLFDEKKVIENVKCAESGTGILSYNSGSYLSSMRTIPLTTTSAMMFRSS